MLKVAALAGAFAVPVWAQTNVSVDATVEFPKETAVIVAATTELFLSVEADGQTEPRKTPVIQLPQFEIKARFEGGAKASPLTEKGPVHHLTGYRISWYPVDRFLGSVDFMGTWDGNKNLVCGFVTWDLSDPDNPVLDTVSANYLELQSLSDDTPAQIHEALLEANCAYGAIEANYTLFDPAG